MEEPTTPDAHSTKSAFHESDIEFLRASAREWLEAVLEEDLDKETGLEDLLADGTMLYRVSQHIKEDQKYPGHVDSPRHFTGSPSASGLKYQPYASVESFLNVCKEVGLRDVDVFNPSDAVDKKDIRRVCVCLRRLSKKARTLHLLVPDFDNVKDTLVTPASKMPREAVQKTKESLQKSASRSSPRSENGQVSSETSSSIADLRKDDPDSESPDLEPVKPVAPDTENASLEEDAKGESVSKEHHDVASEHKESVDTNSKYKVKVAEPGVDTLPLASDHTDSSHQHTEDHKDTNISKSTGASKVTSEASKVTSEASKVTTEAPAALKPTMSKIMLKPPGQAKGPAEEKAKDTEESRKGLFRAHLEGSAPYVEEDKKIDDDDDDDLPWLVPVVAGAVSIVGGVLGLVLWNKRSDHSPKTGSRGFFSEGKKKLAKLTGIADSSSDIDDDGHFYSGEVYNVKDGDNLTKIAYWTGKKHWREIVNKNPSIGNPDLIYPGDRLKL